MEYIALILAVLTGGGIYFLQQKKNRNIPLLLTFSGAYLFGVIVFHLLPGIYGHIHEQHKHHMFFSGKIIGVFLLAGLIFQLLLEYLSHGIEHGHEHLHIKNLSLGVVAGLFIHALIEGIPVHTLEGNAYLYGILIHKIPIAFVLTSFLMHAGYGKTKTLVFLFFFSLMSPLGAWLSRHVVWIETYHILINAFVAGLLTHISTVILFESDKEHAFKWKKMLVILLAFGLSFLMS